jgi:hypothetical protein
VAAVTVYLDGVNVTQFVLEGSVTHTLNGKATATLKMPSDFCTVDATSRCRIDLATGIDFHGSAAHIDDQGDEDRIDTEITFVDPSEIFEFRPARDADGDFSKPSFWTDFTTGPQIIEEIFTNSITYEGLMGITSGFFYTGGVNLSGAPVDWPMTIAEVIGLLTATGEVDVVLQPLPLTTNMAQLNVYNGDYGTDRTSSVQFLYAMGSSSNCRGCRRTIDKTDLMNKLWLYLGPRVKSSTDPAGDQHWRGNITGTDSGLPNPPQAQIDAIIAASRSNFYERMEIRILDADYITTKELYRRWWQREVAMRANPKTLVHLTPHRGIAPAFGIGDLIHVQAGTKFRGGFSGTQRVMEYTYRWDEDGVIELGEPVGQAGAPALVVSSDQEGV